MKRRRPMVCRLSPADADELRKWSKQRDDLMLPIRAEGAIGHVFGMDIFEDPTVDEIAIEELMRARGETT